jgi:hypothetical protein
VLKITENSDMGWRMISLNLLRSVCCRTLNGSGSATEQIGPFAVILLKKVENKVL